ncbi:MAG TPA: NTF2-like N-terminal transpeptidase domain-containing protein, partial [Chloroflexota bacterium]|nr:NTF2-like N-terminal transpeptidase domain-containing protein [Chloroflexota bacterium]
MRSHRRRSHTWVPFAVVIVLAVAGIGLVGGDVALQRMRAHGGSFLGQVQALIRPVSAAGLEQGTVPSPTFTVLPATPVPLANVPPPELTAAHFLQDWSGQHYRQMYALLSQQAQKAESQSQFVAWYTNMAKTAALTKLTTQVTSIPNVPKGAGNGASVQVPFTVSFSTTLVGTFTQNNSVSLVLS